MNPSNALLPLPRYGIRDDELTKPGVVLLDWNDDEQTVRVTAPRRRYEVIDLDLDVYDDMFRPRWHGIGRSAGAVVLGITLGVCLAIGMFVLLEPRATTGGTPGGPTVDIAQR